MHPLVFDVEATGQTPMLHSMWQIGMVDLEGNWFKANMAMRPGTVWQDKPKELFPEVHRDMQENPQKWSDPKDEMVRLWQWLRHTYGPKPKVKIWSDNPGFDWQFLNGYLHMYCGENPLGWSCRRIGDFYAGLMGDARKSVQWKRFRVTEHTHDALDDARGNAEALKKIFEIANDRKRRTK